MLIHARDIKEPFPELPGRNFAHCVIRTGLELVPPRTRDARWLDFMQIIAALKQQPKKTYGMTADKLVL